MLPMAQRADASDAHQPDEQQACNLFRPRDWLSQDVTADDLQSDNCCLSDNDARDGPVKDTVRSRRR